MTRTATDICVLEHRVDPDRPRPALDGAYICRGHHKELERLIAELPARYNDLDRPRGAGGPKISHKTDPGLHIDQAAADLRAQIQHDLLWWCIYVTDQRGFNLPRKADPFTTAAWLTRHVDWLAANRPAAEELLPVLRELTGRAIGITDIPARRVALGEQCLTHADGERCVGFVTLIVWGEEWFARCPECGIDQDATPYIQIAKRGQWVTADGAIRLAKLLGLTASPDLLRQWKYRGHIIGMNGTTENLYELASVQKHFMKKLAERETVGA